MKAEIISIGDEMTSGQRLDTNSQWLSQRLGDLGVTVVAHVTVADDLPANAEVFRQAVERADIVIATGGLGPTADDLTREALAMVSGRPLVLDEAQLDHIRALFARRNRAMPERNVVQAMFPEGSRPIFNPNGTAPGVAIQVTRNGGGMCHMFALPGVPAEMFEMWERSVRPALLELGAGTEVLAHRRIKCFGVGESDLESRLPDLIRRGRVPQVGITVSEATITLRITASGPSVEACQALMQPTVDTIHACLGTLIFGEEDDELQDVILRLLAERNQTLATRESGTQGLLAHWLSAASILGGPYLGGRVTMRPLSGTTIEAAAESCRERFAADYGLAIGLPDGGATPDESPDELSIALATFEGVLKKTAPLAAHPAIVRPLAVKQALNLLRLHLFEV
ncbi:MAG TPA: CinA family nicotinamide mononucleotide deamidase-related protein [Pirellulales bacterium]|nr:CinA family nicotinamide mononucleotide deamidase-related protein [Pirellulales bacterium]